MILGLVGLPRRETGKMLHLGDEAPIVVDRVVDAQPERAAQLVVLFAVAGRDVHEPGTSVHRDERRRRDRAGTIDPGVTVLEAGQRVARHRRQPARPLQARQLCERIGQLGRDDQRLPPPFQRDVFLLGMHGDRQVGRQRPRRRGPDRQRRLGRRRCRRQRAGEREPHVHRRRALLLVLDLGLGERGLAVHAPVHGLQPLVHEPSPDQASELTHDHALVRGSHRHVGVVPIAEYAKSLELVPLDVDELQRVFAAATDLLDGVHRLAHVHTGPVEPELLVHLVLDGQPMAIPARHVDRVEAGHRARLHDDVLEDLVQHVAQVNVAVGVRRSVVQDPQRAIRGHLAQPLVDADLFPPGEHPGLGLGQVGLHGKVGFWQVQRGFVVHDPGRVMVPHAILRATSGPGAPRRWRPRT